MQSNRALAINYTAVNISEERLRIFYKKSESKRVCNARYRMLKKFNMHTYEQVNLFEELFDSTDKGFITRLKEKYTSLTGIERVILAYIKIEVSERHVLKNLGFTEEELKRTRFSICKKLQICSAQLAQTARII
jgi:hypothetical protein